jgi:hypothetical protein
MIIFHILISSCELSTNGGSISVISEPSTPSLLKQVYKVAPLASTATFFNINSIITESLR